MRPVQGIEGIVGVHIQTGHMRFACRQNSNQIGKIGLIAWTPKALSDSGCLTPKLKSQCNSREQQQPTQPAPTGRKVDFHGVLSARGSAKRQPRPGDATRCHASQAAASSAMTSQRAREGNITRQRWRLRSVPPNIFPRGRSKQTPGRPASRPSARGQTRPCQTMIYVYHSLASAGMSRSIGRVRTGVRARVRLSKDVSNDSAISELVTLVQRTHTLGTIGELLGWDEQVNLPAGAAEQRAVQHAALAESLHAAASAPRIGALLTALEQRGERLGDGERAIVTQARRDYDRATKLPVEFVREKAAQGSRGYHAWARARMQDDFAGYAPVLEKNLEFAKREAAYLVWRAATACSTSCRAHRCGGRTIVWRTQARPGP